MDGWALAIMAGWAALAIVFGYGWLRCGNGHWRWQWLRRLARTAVACEQVNSDAPTFGLIAVGCIFSTVLFGIIGINGMPSEPARFLNRTLGELPTLLALFGVAIYMRPWDGNR